MSPPTSTADSTKDVDKSKSAQRKINKPLIEKRRRARINECLAQLKTIVLGADESKSARSSKLEKADILEMTVEYVRSKLGKHNENNDECENIGCNEAEYLAGYSKCLAEISSFLEQTRTQDSSLKKDIVDHVTGKIKCQLNSPQKVDKMDVKKQSSNNVLLSDKQTPILPLVQTCAQREDIPMDLRTNVQKSCDKSQPENSKGFVNTPTATSLSESQKTNSNNVMNTQLPIGVLCGSQMMLLVQLPQTMTSQVTPTVAHQQPVVTSLPNQNLANASQIPMASSSLPDALKTDTSSSGQPTMLRSAVIPVQNNMSTMGNLQFVNFVLPTQNGNSINGLTDDHWRPWSY